MACPFFMPVEKHESSLWIHPDRLPLGSGWKGYCTAPGHQGELPSEQQMRDGCNLGYAHDCPWCPKDRDTDSTRFGISRESGQKIVLSYVCEKAHRPVSCGTLEYDRSLATWRSRHTNEGVQRMAECYLETYLLRKAAGNSVLAHDHDEPHL